MAVACSLFRFTPTGGWMRLGTFARLRRDNDKDTGMLGVVRFT